MRRHALQSVLRAAAARTPPVARPAPPHPSSPRAMYHNLLLLSSVSVAKAIDYYFDWPKALHSTKAFNLLIGLALRSASFASVDRLFTAMRAESTPANMETCKLHVRWFVRIGKWSEAWRRVLEITGRQNATANLPRNPIPLPLWLELFGSQKRGALRHWVVADRSDLDASLPRKRLVPHPCNRSRAVEASRYRALMQVSPLLASSGHVQILPRTILIITRTMYQVGQRNLAFSTALAYLKSLPPHVRRCDRRRALDLVHLHLSMLARHRKPGLKQHFAQRRMLWTFLHARPDLTPSSTTLFLLLGPLRRCRRSGTIAMQCLRIFKKRWGPRVQSRLVRRRVASLALKEGRLDIVAAMLRFGRCCRVSDNTFSRTTHPSRRIPWRTLFSRRGVENRRWHLIEEKYRRRLTQKSPS